MLCEHNFSSRRWACSCSKHVEDNNVTGILFVNKENCALKLVDEINLLRVSPTLSAVAIQKIKCLIDAAVTG